MATPQYQNPTQFGQGIANLTGEPLGTVAAPGFAHLVSDDRPEIAEISAADLDRALRRVRPARRSARSRHPGR
jgi:hypothetical protein